MAQKQINTKENRKQRSEEGKIKGSKERWKCTRKGGNKNEGGEKE